MSQAVSKPARPNKRRQAVRVRVARQTIGERIVALRKARGFTQAELADAIGLSRRMIAHYETQPSNPPAAVLLRLAEVFGVSVDELLGSAPVRKADGSLPPESLRFWRKLRQAEKLPNPDRKRVLDLIDVLLDRQRSKRT